MTTGATGVAPAIGGPQPQVAYAAPLGVHRLCVGGQPLLFSQERQQLFELNETADVIWSGLAAGDDPATVVVALAGMGLPLDQARAFVTEATRGWLLSGHLLPGTVTSALTATPDEVRTLALDEIGVSLSFHGCVSPEPCDAIFSQFYGPTPLDPHRLAIVGHDDLAYLFLDGRLQDVADSGGLAARVKAILTELYANGAAEGFLVHGALLTRDGHGLFLSGEPGAGKTTLSLALAAAGWAYASDDIVRILPDGLARGMPFAPAVKSGAWPLLRDLWPQIDALPIWLRADRQQARYLLPERLADRQPRPLDAIVLLARREGAAAELQPVAPLAALTALLDSAYAGGRGLGASALQALAVRVEAACCRRLVYSELAGAVAALEDLVRVPA